MTNDLTQLNLSLGASGVNQGGSGKTTASGSWFEAMAEAWGNALDEQADRITTKAGELTDGNDSPAQITELTAESLRMTFLSNSSHTSLTSVGTALETLARKQ